MAIENTYFKTLKNTSIFGGAQFFQILIGLIKIKFVAFLLGASGMGLHNLYTSSLAVLITFSSFGINSSGVREISELFSNKENILLGKSIKVYKRLLFITAITGSLLLLIFSPYFSQLTFGDKNQSFSYLLLTIFVFTSILAKGNIAILQGTRKIRSIAICTLMSALFGLVISVPIYYVFDIQGIVPAIIFSGLGSYFISQYYVNKVSFNNESVTSIEFKSIGKKMLVLGFAMVFAQILGQLSIYFTNYFIRTQGSYEDIGFFNAAIGMTSQIVVLLFAALASDYYPRLVAVCNDKVKLNKTVNEQSIIIVLLAIPMLTLFIVFSEFIIKVLLTTEFLQIKKLLDFITVGMFLKVISFSMGYISFAKNDKKTFILLEGVFGNILTLSLSIIGYKFGGLNGLGISFILNYIIYFIVVSTVSVVKYDYKFSKKLIQVIIIGAITVISPIIVKEFDNLSVKYFILFLVSTFSLVFSIYNINKLSGIILTIKNLISRN
tara:strand:+ start:2307 stop:3788 length:1482 start_codon:yes stop_codon:yes gene_type:complete